MKTTRTSRRQIGCVWLALFVLGLVAPVAQASNRDDSQWLKALTARSEALNDLYGLAGTDTPATASAPLVEPSAEPEWLQALMARSEALNRQYRLGAYAPVPHAAGFDWRDAGIGVAAAFGMMLLASAGAIAVRRRRPVLRPHS